MHQFHPLCEIHVALRIEAFSQEMPGSKEMGLDCANRDGEEVSHLFTGLTSDGVWLWQMAGHPKRIRVIDPADGHIVREIGLGEHAEWMGGLFVDGTSYWLGPEQEGMIEQHSLEDNTVLASFGVVPSAEGITIIGSTLWYTSYRQRLLAAVDLRTGQERQRYHLPGDPTGMCWDGAQLWYCDYMHRQLCAVQLPVLKNAAIS